MEQMIQTAFENYPVLMQILGGLLAAHALAQFVVNLTPTPRDNQILRRVYTVVEWVAGVTDVAKDRGNDREEGRWS